MQRVILAACASLILAIPTAGLAQEFKGRVPTPVSVDETAGKLKWVIRPDLLMITNLADSYGIGQGSGEVECTIASNGRPKACTIITEDPKDRYGGFLGGVAALYKAAGKDANGVPSAGRKVRFTFTLVGAKTL